jgi:hypothetical protein
MFFLFLLLISFIVGIITCIPLATYISPPPSNLLIILFAPWLALYYFSQNPTISDIRYMYLSFIIGMCAYWTYYETIKKLKGS